MMIFKSVSQLYKIRKREERCRESRLLSVLALSAEATGLSGLRPLSY